MSAPPNYPTQHNPAGTGNTTRTTLGSTTDHRNADTAGQSDRYGGNRRPGPRPSPHLLAGLWRPSHASSPLADCRSLSGDDMASASLSHSGAQQVSLPQIASHRTAGPSLHRLTVSQALPSIDPQSGIPAARPTTTQFPAVPRANGSLTSSAPTATTASATSTLFARVEPESASSLLRPPKVAWRTPSNVDSPQVPRSRQGSTPLQGSGESSSSAGVASRLFSSLSGVASCPTASPPNTLENQPLTSEERMSDSEGDRNHEPTPNHAVSPSSASQSNVQAEGLELHTHFRGLSLTPAPSLPTESQRQQPKKTKRKRRVRAQAQVSPAPEDDRCLRCRPSGRKPARECVGGGPNRACDPCRASKVSCSKVVSGRQSKRRKVANAGIKRESSPSSDEDSEGEDYQSDDNDADDAKADEDTEEEEALPPPDAASTSKRISHVRGDSEEEELGVMEVEDGDREAPLPSLVSASASASSTRGPPRTFLGVYLPYVRVPDAPSTTPASSSSQLRPEADSDSEDNDGGQLPKGVTARGGRLPSRSASTGRRRRGAARKASKSKARRNQATRESTLDAVSQLDLSCPQSPTFSDNDPPNLGPSEAASVPGPRLETYVPARPIFTVAALAQVAIGVMRDKEVSARLSAIYQNLCLAIETQVEGVILHPWD